VLEAACGSVGAPDEDAVDEAADGAEPVAAGWATVEDAVDEAPPLAVVSSCSGEIEASRAAATGALAGTSTQCAQAKNTMFAATNARKLKRTREF
jgi:hypothetical protein